MDNQENTPLEPSAPPVPPMPDPQPASALPEPQSGQPASQAGTNRSLLRPFVSLGAFILMIALNALANILPLNGLTTGEVSDAYPNLFAPTGLTFSIWGVIYVLLAGFIIYQFFIPQKPAAAERLRFIQILFIISSVLNSGWIIAWHYLQIEISLILMLLILLSLILCDRQLSLQPLSFKEKIFLRLPFALYFGWISVATVANVTVLLVDSGWNRLNLSEAFWMILITAVATLIALFVITLRRNWIYGAVFVWAYIGIIIRHLDAANGFDGRYIMVIITVSICLGLIAAASLLALSGRRIRLSAASPLPEQSR